MIRTIMLAAALLVPGAALAQPADSERPVLSFVLENDVFAEQKADRHYSNGFQLSYMWGLHEEPEWAQRLADALPPFSEAVDIRFEVSAGQKMFTPADISASAPAPGDRPYAGLAYATLGMVSESDRDVLDQVQILVGVVGPSSRADDVQRFVHKAIGAQRPEGWETQIPDQFAWQLRWSRSDTEARFDLGRELELDLVSQLSLSAGNLLSEASLGGSVRLGPSLPRQYGAARIYPSMPGSGFFEPRRNLGWYTFAGFSQRYVLNDLTLDEPDARGVKVTREQWASDIQLGLAIYYGPWHISYTEVWRSKSFKEQRNDWDSFGAISISRAF